MPTDAAPALSLAEHVCLALVDDGVDHGWAIGTELAPDGPLGRVWSLSRPLTYRAVEQLATKGLVRRQGGSDAAGKAGRERSVLKCSAAGRRAVHAWLDEPVEHLRDVRTELLLKLLLRQRRGLEVAELVRRQREAFAPHFNALTTATADGDIVALWRREHARSVRRFLDRALEAHGAPPAPPKLVPLSARNQLRARIVAITPGDVLASVRAVLPDGQQVTAVITRESAVDLDLAPEDEVLVVMKSTEVMLAKP